MAGINEEAEKVMKQITHELSVFDECYGQPKREGVLNLFVPDEVKARLWGQLNYLHDAINTSRDSATAKTLISKLERMGQLIGFDLAGIVENNSVKLQNNAKTMLPTKNNAPFFVWHPDSYQCAHVSKEFKYESELTFPHRFMNGPRDSSKRWLLQGISPDISIYATPNKKDVDAELRVELMGCIKFYFKDGAIVDVVKREFQFPQEDKVDVDSALEYLATWGFTPQQLLYMITNSNLSTTHKSKMAGLTKILSEKPYVPMQELFKATNTSEGVPASNGVDFSAIDFTSLYPYYYSKVSISKMTFSELMATGIPDESLYSVRALFSDVNEKRYALVFSVDKIGITEGRHRVSLYTLEHNDLERFLEIEQLLQKGADLPCFEEQPIVFEEQPIVQRNAREPIRSFAALPDKLFTQYSIAKIILGVIDSGFKILQFSNVQLSAVYARANALLVDSSPLQGKLEKTYGLYAPKELEF